MADLLYVDQEYGETVYRIVDAQNRSTILHPRDFLGDLPAHFPFVQESGKPNVRDSFGTPYKVNGQDWLLSVEVMPTEDGTLEKYVLCIDPENPLSRQRLPEEEFRGFVKRIYRPGQELMAGEQQFLEQAEFDALLKSSEQWIDVSGYTLRNVTITGIAQDMDFSGASFQHCTFTDCTPQNAAFDNSQFRGCVFEDVKIDTSSFAAAKFDETIFSGCSFKEASFRGAELHGVAFNKTVLDGADMTDAAMSRMHFRAMQASALKGMDTVSIEKDNPDLIEAAEQRRLVYQMLGTPDAAFYGKIEYLTGEVEVFNNKTQYLLRVGENEQTGISFEAARITSKEYEALRTAPAETERLEKRTTTMNQQQSNYMPKAPANKASTLRPGSMLFAKLTMESASFDKRDKIFVVKEVRGDGSFTAYRVTSTPKRAEDLDALAVTPDTVNKLVKASSIKTDKEYLFPATYPFVKLHGVITPAQITELMLLQESYKEKNEIKVMEVAEPVTDNKDEIKEAVKDMLNDFRRDPKLIMEYLAFSAKFYRYSAKNCLRIYAQNPYATFVGSKKQFRELGYQVNRDAKKIEILRPEKREFFARNHELVPVTYATPAEKKAIFAKEIQVVVKTYFKGADIYDISQTNCPPSDYPKVFDMGYKSSQHAELFENMKQLSEMSGVPVKLKELDSISLGGYYDPNENTITINSRFDDSQRLNVMCHEYAHALLHRTSTQSKEVKEFEAQCLANMLQKRFGLELSAGEVAYMADYSRKAEKNEKFNLDDSLDRVQKQLRYINKRVELQHEIAQEPELAQQKELQKPLALPVEPDFPQSR